MQYNVTECGKRIRFIREQKSLTQKQTASLLNIRNASLSAIENGHRAASIDLLIDMSELFDVSLDYLVLGREKNMSEDIRIEVREAMIHMKKIVSFFEHSSF